TVFTVLKIMKDYAPFMFTPLVIMLALSVGIDQSSYGASAEEGDDVTHVYVSGGTMSEPYFEFYTDSEGTTQISELDIAHTHTFHRLNGATSHPFYISDSGYEQESSDEITLTGDGSSNSGITGSETFTISFEDGFTIDDTLSFYCTVHSSMIGEFSLTETVALSNIPSTADSTGDHTSLVAALAHANLVGVLSGDGPYTVFAPTDSAFEEIGLNLSDYDTDEENETLAKILSYHVAMGSVMASELEDGMEINSLIQEPITVNIYGQGAVVLNGEASVTTADVETSNGIIHIIDKVLLPPSMSPDTPSEGEICYDMDTHTVDLTKTAETCEKMWISAVDIPTTAAATTIHTSLVAAIAKANLTETLKGEGPFTVFAPSDAAFEDAGINLDDFDAETLANILTYHVVSGKVMSTDLSNGMIATALNGGTLAFSIFEGNVSVNGAKVILADVPVSNGVIHVIDKVMIPPAGEICYDMETHTVDVSKTAETCEKSWIPSVDIPTTAAATTVHSSLVAALVKANLVDTLKGEGPFTVFAPTDEAFAAAGINLDDYDTDEKITALAGILTYHVVSGKVMSTDLTDGMEATALSGDILKFAVGDAVLVNDATVIIADVPVSNGVIHVIDKVLMPVKEEEPKEEDSMPTCDHVIGLDSTGYAYSPASLTIKVGETVCWQWTDSADLHNVAEISSEGDQMRKEGGVYSGETAKTVDFRHTFTEVTTFHYICEPHVGMQMVGKVIVGETSTDSETTAPAVEKEEDTPGFGLVLGVFAVIGIALISRRL
ncbi:MAG: fasciclin domain-containing protein, partial [Candidatus Poseidoniales archaeon]